MQNNNNNNKIKINWIIWLNIYLCPTHPDTDIN